MEIFIEEIPAEGLHINVKAPGEGWLEKVMQSSLDGAFTGEDHAELNVSCYKFGKDVDVKGGLDYTTHVVCDRCLKLIEQKKHLSLKTHLSPLYESRRQELFGDEKELVKDDEEFSYYEGDRFELDTLVTEQVLLSQPMKVLCSEACKGLCQRCGKDLNEGACGCNTSTPDPRWDALKKLKFKEKN